MNVDQRLDAATGEVREALHAAYRAAMDAGDKAEMRRLAALAAEADRLRRRLALGALDDAAVRVATAGRALESRPRGERPAVAPDGAGDLSPDPATAPVAAVAADDVPQDAAIAWGAVTDRKHGPEFKRKVAAIAARLGCDPSHLMAVMAFETGETFDPAQKNGAGSGATGLIQFMPRTARGLGTTTAKLAAMAAVGQLDFVERHFQSVAGGRPLASLGDVYMAVLMPAAIGRPESHVLFARPSRAWGQNRGLDVNRDGWITKAEATAKVHQKLVKGMQAGRLG
jgi:hypothetical protein